MVPLRGSPSGPMPQTGSAWGAMSPHSAMNSLQLPAFAVPAGQRTIPSPQPPDGSASGNMSRQGPAVHCAMQVMSGCGVPQPIMHTMHGSVKFVMFHMDASTHSTMAVNAAPPIGGPSSSSSELLSPLLADASANSTSELHVIDGRPGTYSQLPESLSKTQSPATPATTSMHTGGG